MTALIEASAARAAERNRLRQDAARQRAAAAEQSRAEEALSASAEQARIASLTDQQLEVEQELRSQESARRQVALQMAEQNGSGRVSLLAPAARHEDTMADRDGEAHGTGMLRC